jgi:CheY-like chemotaxis protein
MKILIVEDDPNKLQHLEDLISSRKPDAEIISRRSYQSGLKEVLGTVLDLVVLDMTMPTYDVSSFEKGGRTRVYGGREILREIARRRLPTKVIVVTQFESFGEGAQRKTLDELCVELQRDFDVNYIGTVFYHPAQTEWRDNLAKLCSMVNGT